MSSTPDFKQIKALLLDSDGVLTDGGVYLSADGQQMRRFDIKDGLGLVRLQKAGIHVGIISASPVTSVLERAKTLGIEHAYVGETDKAGRAQALCEAWQVDFKNTAFMGDDIIDLKLLELVGFPIAVADASPVLIENPVVCYVTQKKGGYGAVREVCDLILGPELKANEAPPPSI